MGGARRTGSARCSADARPSIAPDAAIISLSKGLEQGSGLRMTEVVAEVLPDHRPDRIGVLSGPNLAREVALGQPTASVVAVGDPELGRRRCRASS